MISAASLDVIVIAETSLDYNILDSKVIPQGYLVFKCNRNQHGGVVLIAVSLNSLWFVYHSLSL